MRPSLLVKDRTQTWTIKLYDTDDLLVDADSTPTVTVYKNGVVTADVVTVTKRAATTGIYDCSYNPAGEAEGDVFSIEEVATISAVTYENDAWSFSIAAVISDLNNFDPAADTVANVTTVANMRGTDGANTVTPNTVVPDNASIAAILADTDELQTNQGNWTTATTTVASNAPTNWSVMDINVSGEITTSNPALGGGSAHTAEDVRDLIIGASNTNPIATNASGQVEASNMRGTDGANTVVPNTVAPDNASIASILADTNELQLNQGNWLTATATTASNAPANWSVMDINVSGEITTSNPALGGGSAHTAADVRDLILAGDKTPIAVTTGSVDSVILCDTVTTAANMRGTDGANTVTPNTVAPDNASIAAILADTDNLQTNQGNWLTATSTTASNAPTNWSLMDINISGEITTSNPALGGGSAHTAEDVRDLILAGDKTPIAVATGSVSNVVLVDTTTDLTNGGVGGDTKEDIYTYFTTLSREEAFWADLAGISTFNPASDQVVASNMRGTDGANTVAPDNAGVAAIKAKTDQFAFTVANQVDANALTGGGGDDAATIYTYFTAGTNEDAFKADVSGIEASITALNDPTADEIVTAWGNETPAGYAAGSWGYFLDAQVSSAGAGGSGLYQVTVTVQDTSLNALQGARINVDGTTLTLTTDSNGQCVFNLDSGVYTLECSPPAGYDTPTGNVITVTTSDTGSTFTLTGTDPGGGDGCDVGWIG